MKSDELRSIVFLVLFGSIAHGIHDYDTSKGLFDIFGQYITSLQQYYIRNTFPVVKPTNEIKVQFTTDLSQEEKLFLTNRDKKVRDSLQKYFEIDAPLTIAFCCGGGGNRSLIGLLGLLSGAAKTNVLDVTTYIAGVSGSTWAIVPYFYQTACMNKNNIDAISFLLDYYSSALSDGTRLYINNYYTPALLKFDQMDNFFKDLLIRYCYQQDISLVDLFGALIGQQCLGFLGEKALETHWSDMKTEALEGNAPLPLCTAAFNDNADYGYFEMSPFQSGNKKLGYIPTQYLGSKFTNYQLDMDGICPEYSLSFCLGMYGSAFAAVVQYLYQMQQFKNESVDALSFLSEAEYSKKYIRYKGWNLFYTFSITNKIEEFIKTLLSKDNTDFYVHFSNYNPQALQDDPWLGLFDAGIGCDFPIAPLLDRPERNIDIIILYDSHPGSIDVQIAYDYAAHSGIYLDKAMKTMSINELAKESMFVFNDPRSVEYNPLEKTILYFPTQNIDISSPPYTTFNFKYEINEIKKLKELMENSLVSNIETIRSIMKLIAKKKIKEN